MYRRLKHKFKIPEYKVRDSKIRFGIDVDGVFKGIEYFNVTDLDQLFLVIPEQFRKHFGILEMCINTHVPPHSDSGILSTINFYVKPDNCITEFYRIKNDPPKTYQLDNQTDGFIYHPDDLEKVGGFVAMRGDAWLLDVTVPHSVTPLTQAPIDRIAVALATNKYSAVQVYDMLKMTGNA